MAIPSLRKISLNDKTGPKIESITILTSSTLKITFDEEALRYSGPIENLIVPVLEELELRTIAKRIFGVSAAEKKASSQLGLFKGNTSNAVTTSHNKKNIDTSPHNYKCLSTFKERKRLIETLDRLSEFCFDTETTSLSTLDAVLVGLAISYEKGTAFYVPFPEDRDITQEIINEFKSIFVGIIGAIIGMIGRTGRRSISLGVPSSNRLSMYISASLLLPFLNIRREISH